MSIANPPALCRFPLVDPATATDPIVRAVYAEIERELGFGIVPNIFRAMAVQPVVLRASWDLFRATILTGRLPRGIKEMVGVVVSAANQSEYALKVHLHSLGVQGVSAAVLNALAAGAATGPDLAPSVAAILRLAHAVARDRSLAASDALITAVQDEGITTEELAEIFATINLFQYVNSFTDLACVPVDAL